MNKHIDRLSSIAHEYAIRNTQEGDNNYGLVKAQKFAELLIAECATTLSNNYPPDDLIPVEEAIGCITTHFGVKL